MGLKYLTCLISSSKQGQGLSQDPSKRHFGQFPENLHFGQAKISLGNLQLCILGGNDNQIFS